MWNSNYWHVNYWHTDYWAEDLTNPVTSNLLQKLYIGIGIRI